MLLSLTRLLGDRYLVDVILTFDECILRVSVFFCRGTYRRFFWGRICS